jgi:hypothetical protein
LKAGPAELVGRLGLGGHAPARAASFERAAGDALEAFAY